MRQRNHLSTSDEDLHRDEAATRRLLAHYQHPTVAEPPAGLAERVVAALPLRTTNVPARPIYQQHIVRWAGVALVLCLLGLQSIGAWGIFADSSGPAQLVGNPATGVGRDLLVLVLAVKPVLNIVTASGVGLLILAVALVAVSWLWWQLVRQVPGYAPLEVQS